MRRPPCTGGAPVGWCSAAVSLPVAASCATAQCAGTSGSALSSASACRRPVSSLRWMDAQRGAPCAAVQCGVHALRHHSRLQPVHIPQPEDALAGSMHIPAACPTAALTWAAAQDVQLQAPVPEVGAGLGHADQLLCAQLARGRRAALPQPAPSAQTFAVCRLRLRRA